MDPKNISKKDQVILQQLEVIRTMTEHNLSRMGTDFWGAPPLRTDRPEEKTAENSNTAASTGNDGTKSPEAEVPPPEPFSVRSSAATPSPRSSARPQAPSSAALREPASEP